MQNPMETLDALKDLRERLIQLKRDRSKPLTEEEFTEPYAEFERIVENCPAWNQEDALRDIITDLLLIFSLGFLTVGLCRQVPATYASLLVMRQLLAHLTYVPNFTPQELQVLERRITEIEELLHEEPLEGKVVRSGPVVKSIIIKLIADCRLLREDVQSKLDLLKESEVKAFSQILHVRREILTTVMDDKFDPSLLKAHQDKVELIVQHLCDSGSTLEDFSEPIRFQIIACRKFCSDFADGAFVKKNFKEEYDELRKMGSSLQLFLMTHRWTLRETDLYSYIVQTSAINKVITKEIFVKENWDDDHFLLKRFLALPFFELRRCLATIYKLIAAAEPVTEALLPIFNKLLTTRRCLKEVRDCGGISNLRELYPYQMKLASLDNLRVDGKFMVGDEVPTGQGRLIWLLAECFDLVYELQVDLEERSRGLDSEAEMSSIAQGEDEDDDDEDEDEDEEEEEDDEEDEEDESDASNTATAPRS